VVSEWFPGDGRTPEGQDFLGELRARAAAWGLADVRAPDTGTASDRWGWLVAYARVPGVRDGEADLQLQVGFGLAATAAPLVAAWGTDGVLLDRWAELGLSGYDSSPAGMARRTYDWFTEQLLRHVERLSWRTRRNRTTSLWRLADGEGPIWAERAARRRLDRGTRPDDVVRVR
jgi:hypothetical protein